MLKGHPTIEPDDFQEIHFSQPFAIKDYFRAARIEDLECLDLVGFGVGHHLLAGQHRPGCRSAARIAHHRSEIADDQHRDMAQILKLPQLEEIDRMPQMQIGRRRVDAEFDSKRTSLFQFLFQFGFIDQLRATPFQKFYRLFR